MSKRSAKPAKAPKSRKPSKTPSTSWWEVAEEVPRAGLPDARRLERRAKWVRRWIWFGVFATPLALLTVFITVAGSGAAPVKPVTVDAYASTKATAMVEVRKWLAQTPSPLPGGVLIGWTDADKHKSPVDPTAPEDAYTVEVHHLTVADSNGTLYDAVVSLATSPYIGATVIGEPSLTPLAPPDTSFTDSGWPGLESGYVSDESTAAILAWAEAYTSGDPGQLRLAVGDTDQARSYTPLNGATLADAQIGDSAAIFDADTPVEQRDPNTADTLVVRVDFAIHWKGVHPDSDNDWPRVTYDVLVKKADTAAPVVVAWGGPGSGPDLKPYGNAIENREIEAADPDTNPTGKNSVVGKDDGQVEGDLANQDTKKGSAR